METMERREVSRRYPRPTNGTYRVPGLRRARVRREVSQRELAAMTGVAYATISRLENGHHKAQGATVIKLAEALGARWRELLREPLEETPIEEDEET